MSVRLADEPFAAERELAQFTAGLAGKGAVVSFLGIARPRTSDGELVQRLVLDHHPRLTLSSLNEIAAAALERFEISSLRIVHRRGAVAPGETIVFVAAAAVHRRAGFEAADYMMDRLKTDAVFWKREDGPAGPRWIEPREDDYSARERWNEKPVAGIDESRIFHPLRIAVLTVSDSRTDATDTSGGLLAERLQGAGHALAAKAIVGDEVEAIRGQVKAWVADADIDVILTTGGTGFAPRDVTPEALKPLFSREMDGFPVVFHRASLGTVGLSTLQSRACAGQVEETFVFCLPGSTGACRDGWDLVLRSALDSRYRPCSFAEQVPRLRPIFQ